MLSIRAMAAMAFIAVVATVSAAPAAEPVQALADFPVPDGYKFCTTRPISYMKCWEYCAESRKKTVLYLLKRSKAVRASSTMDYLFVAAGAGAGVYYMFSRVVEPLQQAKRASEAERARQELLLLEEERLLKRGPNRQVKKRPVSATHLKQVDPNNVDSTSEHLSENIPTSNPFNLLEGNGTDPSPSHSRTRSEVKRILLSSSSKTVSVSTLSKTVVSSERRSITKSGVERVHAEGQSAASSKSSSSTSSSSFTVLRDVARNAQLVATLDGDNVKHVQDLEIQLPQTPQNEVSEPVVITTDYLMLSQELQALQAILKAKELELTAADARNESAQRKIQDLQQQLESDQNIVQAAKKSEAKSQKREEKLESLNYTNTLLVNQLTLERENWKAAAAAQNQGQGSLPQEQLAALPCEKCNLAARDLKDEQLRAEAVIQELHGVQVQMSKHLHDKDTNIKELMTEIENLIGQIEAYKDALEHVEAVAQTGKLNIESEKRVLEEEVNRLQDELNRLKDGHATEARQIEAALEEMEQRENELQKQLLTKEALLEIAQSTVAANESKISDVRERVSGLHAELELAQTEIESLSNSLRMEKETNEELMFEKEELLLEKEELLHKLNAPPKTQPPEAKAESKQVRDEVGEDEAVPVNMQETMEEETTIDEAQDEIEEVQLSMEVQYALDPGFGGERGLVAAF
ncbi:hypothetical protein KVV02_004992 [Mortierella alpina]|uniref:Uncharacterized protein n=1 Tax=Mortierella alpina TaxID=64518 RepID=A0A9P8A1E9_MORAP|nr:hypothetical protein KVV02_004992 [Mortierella alpina]